ncbi:FAD-binding oxidoreductase [Rhizobiales bacterium Sp-1]|uniref:FAD-binding oxidoreductase n=1 Tax=Segnochrobactrum spirostomi TaxID=2608987 RepID=A0A6A7Y9S0_9HYPH|nr:FAD-binding oxidoreductase [Segnochrobactrum spirostomi]
MRPAKVARGPVLKAEGTAVTDSDFLIIGGGIAGLSAGAALSGLGRVTVLEAESALAFHASGRSAALYEPMYGAPSVVALSQASAETFFAVPDLLKPRGLMLVASADEEEAFRHEVAAMALSPIGVAEARDAVPVLNPESVAFAARGDQAWDIDTDLLIQAHARTIRAHGGTIVTDAAVTGLARTPTGWLATTKAGEFGGRLLINAAGAWADAIARLAGVAPVGLQPLRRSMARIPAPGGHDIARWPMIFGPGESFYAKPDAGALIVSPAEEHPVEPHDAWADDMVLAEGLARYEAMVTEPVSRLLASWAGLRTFAPDRVLVIGPDPDEPAFFWLAGQGGYGFQTSAAVSRLVADLIAGRPPALDRPILAAVDPARLRS